MTTQTVDDLFPSRFMKAGDIGEADLIVTITGLEVEELGQDKQKKPVLFFQETDKGMVLNKTNADTIRGMYGNNIPGWNGKKIALYTTEVTFAGKTSLGIRVRVRPPQAARRAAPAPVVEPEWPEDN